jgi:hypothetical protein
MISILKCILWFCGLCFLFFPSASKSVSLCPRKIDGQGCEKLMDRVVDSCVLPCTNTGLGLGGFGF